MVSFAGCVDSVPMNAVSLWCSARLATLEGKDCASELNLVTVPQRRPCHDSAVDEQLIVLDRFDLVLIRQRSQSRMVLADGFVVEQVDVR